MSLEIDLQRELDAAQKLCVEYESRATPLGILDGPVSVSGFDEAVNFGQEINGAAENPVPEGISTIVKSALQRLRAGTKEEINMLREAQVNLEEEMTKLREIIAEYGDVQAGLDVEYEAVDREKVDLNEVSPLPLVPFHLAASRASLLRMIPCTDTPEIHLVCRSSASTERCTRQTSSSSVCSNKSTRRVQPRITHSNSRLIATTSESSSESQKLSA